MFRYLFLPLRAPMLMLLLLVSVYMGAHWVATLEPLGTGATTAERWGYVFFWPAQCLQTLLVVMVCTMPDLLLRQLSLLMSSSKVVTLVLTLLMVITGGLYLLHLNVLADVLILASTVLLARLDLTRLRMVPPPLVGALTLGMLVLIGMGFGAHLQQAYPLVPA